MLVMWMLQLLMLLGVLVRLLLWLLLMMVVAVVVGMVMQAMVMNLAVMVTHTVVVHFSRNAVNCRVDCRRTVFDPFRLVFDLVECQQNSGSRSGGGRYVPFTQVGFVA